AASAVATVPIGLRSNGATTVRSGEALLLPGTLRANLSMAAFLCGESFDSSQRCDVPQPPRPRAAAAGMLDPARGAPAGRPQPGAKRKARRSRAFRVPPM